MYSFVSSFGIYLKFNPLIVVESEFLEEMLACKGQIMFVELQRLYDVFSWEGISEREMRSSRHIAEHDTPIPIGLK